MDGTVEARENRFLEIKLFQVKPDKTAEFEALATEIAEEQKRRPGCTDIKYMKRFYTVDGIGSGDPPRELTKIVKCVKYFSCWEFDHKENYGKAVEWFFTECLKPVQRLLIAPFDIHCGDSVY
ncbi:MAG: antibiotic biosynthesis monooxygenase [Oscillospiraceae bacterium]|nr:antibiotic biosynthesis monooxygenase [Oscillospiraceae bacterium]